MGCLTNGYGSLAYGISCSAIGDGSFAGGASVKAYNMAEFSVGKYNASTESELPEEITLFSIGNGEGEGSRHNAFEVKENGEIYIVDTSEYANNNYAELPMMSLQDALKKALSNTGGSTGGSGLQIGTVTGTAFDGGLGSSLTTDFNNFKNSTNQFLEGISNRFTLIDNRLDGISNSVPSIGESESDAFAGNRGVALEEWKQKISSIIVKYPTASTADESNVYLTGYQQTFGSTPERTNAEKYITLPYVTKEKAGIITAAMYERFNAAAFRAVEFPEYSIHDYTPSLNFDEKLILYPDTKQFEITEHEDGIGIALKTSYNRSSDNSSFTITPDYKIQERTNSSSTGTININLLETDWGDDTIGKEVEIYISSPNAGPGTTGVLNISAFKSVFLTNSDANSNGFSFSQNAILKIKITRLNLGFVVEVNSITKK